MHMRSNIRTASIMMNTGLCGFDIMQSGWN